MSRPFWECLWVGFAIPDSTLHFPSSPTAAVLKFWTSSNGAETTQDDLQRLQCFLAVDGTCAEVQAKPVGCLYLVLFNRINNYDSICIYIHIYYTYLDILRYLIRYVILSKEV